MMADLADGESVEMKGSAAAAYVIKNMGGVYSCSCPAWRNQSTPIEQRTCKHIRKLRGDEAENQRIGTALPQKPVRAAKSLGDGEDDAGSAEPPILLAEAWDSSQDLAGWWMSEKLDGVRAYWDGKQFLSRQGNLYHAPDWFLEGLPNVPLDGELWIDRKAFQRTVSIVRRQDKNDQWRNVRYLVFDAPAMTNPFEERMVFLNDSVNDWRNEFVTVHPQELCRDVAHLRAELERIESLGGEGLMLRQPGSKYFAGRSSTLLKVKTFIDAEAVVLRHEPGKGRHAGRLGALAVKFPDGTEFSVGTGFSDRERESPPPIGSLIQFRFQELSDAGVPRFPSYIGLRTDVAPAAAPFVIRSVSEGECSPTRPTAAPLASFTPSRAENRKTATLTSPRYFEFVEGSSSKFWEITLNGSDVTTRWGRIGTDGQSKTKPFTSEDKAKAEYDKLVQEKTNKGYVEVGGSADDEVEDADDDKLEDATEQVARPESSKGVADDADSTELAKPVTPVSKEIEELVLTFAEEIHRRHGSRFDSPDVVPTGAKLLGLKSAQQVEVMRACILFREHIEKRYRDNNMVEELRNRLLRRKLPYTDDDIRLLAAEITTLSRDGGLDTHLIGAIEAWTRSNRLPLGAAQSLREARDNAYREWYASQIDSVKTRIDALVGDQAVRLPIQPSEVWAIAAREDIEGLPEDKRSLWTQLIQSCAAATSSKPTDKWLKTATPLIEAITREEFLKFANRWLSLVEKQWPDPRASLLGHPLQILDGNQIILRGLVWFCSLAEDRDTTRTLGNLARTCFRTVPNIGPRSAKVGNTVVFTLGAMKLPDAVTQLAILKVKVKNGHAQKFIEGELNKAAERLGIGREELEEMSVPAYGLDEVGLRCDELGDFTAKLTVDSGGATELNWLKADGSVQKSVPAKVQQEFAEDLKELKTAAKDIQKMVGVQRERIDSLFLQQRDVTCSRSRETSEIARQTSEISRFRLQREWSLTAWTERYLNHPLVGIIARRLLWVFRNGESSVVGAFLNGTLTGLHDEPLTGLGDETQVSLWHPIGHAIDEIVAWREWLERHSITQPFKQAHREVYLLTDAERGTSVYSNRFAAHVLRQTQLRTLAQGRGWHAKLLGGWDGGGDSQIYRYLPRWNITAQFWVNAIYDDVDATAEMPESAGVPFVSTDQVRFYSGEHKEYAAESDLMPLSDVPELVLSEVMRDVDLFVGVASIGNDPNWHDGGEARFGDYWTGYSFGSLSESAKTRRQVLERLIPRLKIANRCSFEDRFLVVRGDLRTYRIHFGSGNIQMEPNNQYLCIVPKPGANADTFLPFEGDRTLSIILSKALLLADDKKIKDLTILSQIARQ